MMTIDRFDLRILGALQSQGDIGPQEMSQKVHLSASQCSRRMQALRKAGFVKAVRAVIDPNKVAVGLQAYVLVTLKSHSPKTAHEFRERLLRLDEVLECYKLTGASDMIIKVATRDLGTFNDVLTNELLGAPEVAHAQSSIILEEIKCDPSLPLKYAL
jgi:Lrp/AsnC family leucine-responsive transcriptional regulator